MFESLKVRFTIIFATIILGLVYFLPNLKAFKESEWLSSKSKLIYGLDIQGGLHLVLSANVNEILQERISQLQDQIKEDLKKQSIEIQSSSAQELYPFPLSFVFASEQDKKQAVEAINKTDIVRSVQVIDTAGNTIKLMYYESRIKELKKQAVDQSIEVIRNRIDEFGVSEPLINSQGGDRILVQLPGVKDSQRAKELIQKTAKLELALVNEKFPAAKLVPLIEQAEKQGQYSLEGSSLTYREYVKKINKDLKNKIPKNHRIVFEKASSVTHIKEGKVPYLVDINQSVQGSLLEDAFVGFDPDFNQPQVIFKFQPEGRKLFGELTGKIIGQRLAVILDNVLKSAPTVESRITERGQISLGQGNYEDTLEEANMIATTLRAGALPVTLEQLEEKTVGPTLGQDSIDKGKMAGLIGLILVMIFIFVYYRVLGFVSNICLGLNIFYLLSLLSSLSATLTLPGVAGIILTIGMAVDSNVIIFERIKEELRKGASLKLATRDGFGHAFSAILDANITTAIVCFVLIYFGTGPIRGFAVTLFCGVLTSLFSAVFISRTLIDFMIVRLNLKKV